MTTIAAADFDYLSVVLRERSAIVLEPGKEYLADSRLQPVAKAAGLADVAELIAAVRRSPESPLLGRIVDAMTTNETLWFRDVHPFDCLRDDVLPRLIAARRSSRTLSVWCAAASTGQEPYSLAMLIRDHFPELDDWAVRIVATDLSPTVLEKARTGRYSQLEVNRGLPANLLVKYFRRDGAQWLLEPIVRSMVTFEQMNLIGAWPYVARPDLVLIRNVLIYFDHDTKQQILLRIRDALAADGVLMLGSSEAVHVDAFSHHVAGRTSYYQPKPGSRP